METIVRQDYLDKIEKYLGRDTIIILTGQRRVGKSYLLRQLRDKVSQSGADNIIFIDKEKKEFDLIKDYKDLNEYIDSRRKRGVINYILIDEIQNIEGFEKSVRSYYEDSDVEIVVTGSNSKMLSSDLSTLIGGRYKEIYVQSLSYKEFMTFHHLADSDDTLAKYIQIGGLPGLVRYGLDEREARDYQSDVYHTALLKDVVMRNQIRNVTFLGDLAHFMADNSGKLISANSISKYLKSQGSTVTATMVLNYIKSLSEAYILRKVLRFDIHGKRLFDNNAKYYFEDHGIRNMLAGGNREGDIEKVIENIIYNHLIRLGYDVNVGQLQVGEIDFVCNNPVGERVYVQASYLIGDEATRQREFGNLSRIRDNYPKFVISMTPLVDRADNQGITHLHLRRFLTDGLA